MKRLLIVAVCSIALMGCSARQAIKYTTNAVVTAATGSSDAGEAASWAAELLPAPKADEPKKSEEPEE